MIRLGVGNDELAFLSTLALISTDNLLIACDGAQASQLRDVENKVLQSFDGYMHQRWSSRPTLIGKLVSI